MLNGAGATRPIRSSRGSRKRGNRGFRYTGTRTRKEFTRFRRTAGGVLLRARGNKMKQRVLALAIKRDSLGGTRVDGRTRAAGVRPEPAGAGRRRDRGCGRERRAVTRYWRAAQRAAPLHRTLRRPMQHRCSSRRDACRTRRERAGQGRADQAVRSDGPADPAGRQDGFPAGADDHAEGNPGQRG